MKKVILFFILFSFSLTGFSQDSKEFRLSTYRAHNRYEKNVEKLNSLVKTLDTLENNMLPEYLNERLELASVEMKEIARKKLIKAETEIVLRDISITKSIIRAYLITSRNILLSYVDKDINKICLYIEYIDFNDDIPKEERKNVKKLNQKKLLELSKKKEDIINQYDRILKTFEK